MVRHFIIIMWISLVLTLLIVWVSSRYATLYIDTPITSLAARGADYSLLIMIVDPAPLSHFSIRISGPAPIYWRSWLPGVYSTAGLVGLRIPQYCVVCAVTLCGIAFIRMQRIAQCNR